MIYHPLGRFYQQLLAFFSLPARTQPYYFRRYQVENAARLLLQGGYRVYEVAAMVGFSSQNNFAQSFHKQFGMSPTDYVQAKQMEKGKQ